LNTKSKKKEVIERIPRILSKTEVPFLYDAWDYAYIRRCTPEDLEEILNIQQTIIDELKKEKFEVVNSDDMKQYLQKHNIYFLGIQTPIGICSYSYTIFDGHFSFVQYFDNTSECATFQSAVLPKFQENDLHSHLLRATIKEAKKRGSQIIVSVIPKTNKVLLDIFKKHDFEIVRKAIKNAEYSDKYVLYRNLASDKNGTLCCPNSS
jgi:L-amino acid N-acyltransferase YncA